MQFCVFRAKKSNSIERERGRERGWVRGRVTTLWVWSTAGPQSYFSTTRLSLSLLPPLLVRLPSRVIIRGKFPNLLSISPPSVAICLEIIFSLKTNFVWKLWRPSFATEPASAPHEDESTKQVNLRTRKRLSPVCTDENLPSKRRRRRKFSDCSSSSTCTVNQDSEPMTSPQEWKIIYQSKQASNMILYHFFVANFHLH